MYNVKIVCSSTFCLTSSNFKTRNTFKHIFLTKDNHFFNDLNLINISKMKVKLHKFEICLFNLLVSKQLS